MAHITIRRKNRPDERFDAADGVPLTRALRARSAAFSLPCGGTGICGKCRVQAPDAPVTPLDRTWLSEQELARGVRLACQAVCRGEIIVDALADTDLPDEPSLPSDNEADGYGLAVDIGTTTVACYLVDLKSDEVCRTLSLPNRQAGFGADVISRIHAAACEDGTRAMQALIAGQIEEMALCLTDDRPDRLRRMAVTGNSVMLHLFFGVSPASMGTAPYRPQFLDARALRSDALAILKDTPIPVISLPGVSSFVGADLIAAAYAAKLDRGEQPAVLLDIGTNAEMIAANGGEFFCCSASAGPALEGGNITCGMAAQAGAIDAVRFANGEFFVHTIGDAPAAGLCGSGLIDLIALLLDLRILLPDGSFFQEEPWEECFAEKEGRWGFWLTDRVVLTPEDVRAVQLAKASIAAGLETLLHESGISAESFARFELAGAFGSHIRLDSAVRIGLIPASVRGRVRFLGNAAGEGACRALRNPEQALEAMRELIRHTKAFELSERDNFQERFLRRISF